MELLNSILKYGEYQDTYKIKNKNYYVIVYENKTYTIEEYRDRVKVIKMEMKL